MGIVIKKNLKKAKPSTKVQHVPTAQVTKAYKDGSVVEEQIPLGAPYEVEDANKANVGLALGLTKNLGNYESLKVTVSLFLPCAPVPEEIEETYAEIKGWVDAKIEDLNEEIQELIGH